MIISLNNILAALLITVCSQHKLSADVRQVYVNLFDTSSQPVFRRTPRLRADADYVITSSPHTSHFYQFVAKEFYLLLYG
jgi:hypothetical protein